MADKNEIQTLNEVHAEGRIIGTGKNYRGYYTVRLFIRGRKNAIVSFVVDAMDSSIRYGDYVKIDGFTRSYGYQQEPYADGQPRKWVNVQEFVAVHVEKIEETEMMQKFGLEGRYYDAAFFRAYIKGEVTTALNISDRYAKLVVKTSGGGTDRRPSYIVLNYQKGGHWLPAFDYAKGDVVCVVASVYTTDKDLRGEQVHFENLVVEDIVRVFEAPRDAAPTPARVMPSVGKNEIDAADVGDPDEDFEDMI